MNKIKIYCSWDLSIDLETEKQVELYVDIMPSTKNDGDLIRFIFMLEPPEILDLSTYVLRNQDLFDYVLTHNQEVIDKCDKALLFPFGSTWIREYNFSKKEFEVSTLVGFKLLTEGHRLRQKLWYKQDRIVVPKKFFMSNHNNGLENFNNNPILGNDKNPLFDSQFHIVVENVSRKNWFTEKLIDTLITKTVPIYYGCPNIGDWFDTRGFFMVNNLEDIVQTCNSLTSDTYERMIPYVEENYKRALKLSDISVRIKETIEKTIANN
jgi:hypothetical protein